MSETDSFIDEVTEEVRRDKLFAFAKKWGWAGVLAVIVIVGSAGWREYSKAQAEAAARAFGDAVTAAQAENDPAARLKALDAVPTRGADQKAVLHLLASAAAVEAGDPKAAAVELAPVAADQGLPPAFRDLAALKQAIIAPDMDAAARKAAFAALSQPGRPYRVLALEQLALLAAGSGDKADAIKQFKALLQEPEVTTDLRSRATAMIVALGGDPAAS